jgi:thioredoxin
MKLTAAVLCALVVVSALSTGKANGKDEGIRFFQGTLKQAIAKAKEEKKPIFFDAYASWCGPCKTMDVEVFTDSTVAAFFNREFICIRVDMEKGEGPSLAKRYPSINGYPSLLFLDSRGFCFKTVLGSRDSKNFLAEARLAAGK